MPIRFNINPQKAIEALLWIVQRGETNVYNAMKIIFAADKHSLNKYGFPVTGDNYVAMQYGTVPSWTYAATRLTDSRIGFTRDGNTLKLSKGRTFKKSMFSESDIESLEHGFKEYAGKGFKAVERKNHRERAWIAARERNPQSGAPDILFEDMIDEQWLKEDLAVDGQFIKI